MKYIKNKVIKKTLCLACKLINDNDNISEDKNNFNSFNFFNSDFKKVLLSYFLLKLLQHSHTVLKKFLKFLNAFKDIIIFLFNEIVSFLINHSFF